VREALVEVADVEEDLGHLVDRVVAPLGGGAVAGDPCDVHPDLHPAAVAAVDAVVGRLGGHHERGAHAVLLDEVQPAQAVAVLLLHGSRDHVGVGVREQAEVLRDPPAVHRGDDATQLVRRPPAADQFLVLEALERVEVPVLGIADADGVDVAVESDEGLPRPHGADRAAEPVDAGGGVPELLHLRDDQPGLGLLLATGAPVPDEGPEKGGHVRPVPLGCLADAGVVDRHGDPFSWRCHFCQRGWAPSLSSRSRVAGSATFWRNTMAAMAYGLLPAWR